MRITNHIRIFLIIALVPLLCCSKREDESSPRTDELMFEVDSTKLEALTEFVDWGIAVHAPREWKFVEEKLLFELSQNADAVNLHDSVFACQPIAVFFQRDNQSVLFISNVSGVNDSDSFMTYQHLIQEKLAPRKSGSFLKDQITFSQFLIQDEQHVNFKLLMQNNKRQLIQFDYIVPMTSYLSELKAVEASIGSIHLIHVN